MNFLFKICLALALIQSSSLVGQDLPEVEQTPFPDWVELGTWDREAAGRDRQDFDGDTHYLLYDRQSNAAVEDPKNFRHIVYRFLTENGVQDNSQIEISFDPEYQTLEIHSLLVHRDGEVSDRLSSQEVKLIQREEDMNRHLYDGRLTAVIVLEDIRVGDVLEYSYTRKGSNPIFEGHFMMSFSTEWSTPLEKGSVRLLWPADREISFRSHAREIDPEKKSQGDIDEYVWNFSAETPLIADDETPSWFDPWGYVQVSDFKNWKEVADCMLGIYDIGDQLPEELQKVVNEFDRTGNRDQLALEAIRYVQDEFRYLGFESGVNSHKPYPIETIVSRRFGDCKDKSTLLCSILRNLGFDAYPALVNTSDSKSINEWLPSIHAFDHVVVQLRMPDRTLWIDPTISLQGGQLDELFFPDYGYALVIAPETDSLEPLVLDGQNTATQETIEAFDFQDYSGDSLLRVTTYFWGYEADRMRRRFSQTSITEMGKDYANFYASIYKNVKVIDSLVFHDDREANILTCFETYSLSDYWEADAESEEEENPRIWGEFSARSFKGFLEKPDTRDRTMPFELLHPIKVAHQIRAEFPWPLQFTDSEEKVDSDSVLASFKCSSVVGALHLDYTYETKKDNVTAENFSSYIDDIERIEDNTFYSFSLPADWAIEPGSLDNEALEETEETPEGEIEDTAEWLQENGTVVAWIGGFALLFIIVAIATVVIFIVVVSKKPAAPAKKKSLPPPLPKSDRAS